MSLKTIPKGIFLMTENMSLETWDQKGILEREIESYVQMNREHASYAVLTYGYKDQVYRDKLGSMRILHNRYRWGSKTFQRMVPALYFTDFLRTNFIKTNQIKGARFAVALSSLFRKKLILRCGYLASATAVERSLGDVELNLVMNEERYGMERAYRVVVTTNALKDYLIRIYGINSKKVRVIPNYVDTNLFRPKKVMSEAKVHTIVSIANRTPGKNIGQLIQSVQGLESIHLRIIGSVCEDNDIKALAQAAKVSVEWIGIVSNAKLAQLLSEADLYVHPSLYEGLSKSILEAMSCGLPIIGCCVTGVKELIQDGVNGLLCEPNVTAMRAVIVRLISSNELMDRLGKAARSTIETNYSLDRILSLEKELVNEVMGNEL